MVLEGNQVSRHAPPDEKIAMTATLVERIVTPFLVSTWPHYPTYEINTWIWL